MTIIRKIFKQRDVDQDVLQAARGLGLSEMKARIVAGRANGSKVDLEEIIFPKIKNLHHPELLQDGKKAAEIISAAIMQGQKIGILTDYDVDGICSHVVLYESLRHFGVASEKIISLIGHRMLDGYGVSVTLVDRILALDEKPQLIITADCGSSDEEQIKRLRKGGMEVIVTDHHAIPEEGIPGSALATVNPTRKDCRYPDEYISGCMVSWLLMCLVRTELIVRGEIAATTGKLGIFLDYVCLSTVADAVSLFSPTNRAVIKYGLGIINELAKPSWYAFASQLDRADGKRFTAEDLGFQIAPRINARSRMADPYAALQFFLSENTDQAFQKLTKLEKSNDQRKQAEQQMIRKATRYAVEINGAQKSSLVIADDTFHAGVQGIVASRLVDAFGKPAVVFSPVSGGNILSGSARTINGIHVRDVLQKIHEKHAKLMESFGGHKGAAGLKIKKENFEDFRNAFEEVVVQKTGGRELHPVVLTDGRLAGDLMTLQTLKEMEELEPYGREFEEPVFEGVFTVQRSRLVGSEPIHLSMQLQMEERNFQGIWFRAIVNVGDKQPVRQGDRVKCAYKLKLNDFRGRQSLQLFIEYAETVE